MTELSALETRLRELGAVLDVPRIEGLAARVREELEDGTVVPLRPRRRRRTRTVALAAAAALLVGGAAVATRLALRGVEIRRVPTAPATPSVGASPTPLELLVGRRVTFDEARREVAFPVRSLAALGDPTGVFLDDEPSGGAVTIAYPPRADLPADESTGAGALLTSFVGEVAEEFVVKEAGPGTAITRVTVNGRPGFWISGEPHTVLYRDTDGQPYLSPVRLAGNVLLWQVGDVTYRLEADISLDRALRLASSLGGT